MKMSVVVSSRLMVWTLQTSECEILSKISKGKYVSQIHPLFTHLHVCGQCTGDLFFPTVQCVCVCECVSV